MYELIWQEQTVGPQWLQTYDIYTNMTYADVVLMLILLR